MILKSQKKDILENLMGLLVVIVVIICALYFLDFNNIQKTILAAGLWAPIILILAKAMTVIFAPLSGSALYPIAGAIFGFGPGFTYIVIGDFIGSTVAFLISRKFGQKTVERFLSKNNMPTAQKIMNIIESTKGFLFARVCFSPMPEIVAYAAGLTKIPLPKFLIIYNLVGLVPTAILVAGGDILVNYLHDPKIIIGLFVGGLFAVLLGGGLFFKFSDKFIK